MGEPPMAKTPAAVANSMGATISQARYKEPPMRKAQQPIAQIPRVSSPPSPQRSEPAATKAESVVHRDFEDEFDDATRWAEASATPSKAPTAVQALAAARSRSAPSQPDAASEQAAKSSRYKAPPAEW